MPDIIPPNSPDETVTEDDAVAFTLRFVGPFGDRASGIHLTERQTPVMTSMTPNEPERLTEVRVDSFVLYGDNKDLHYTDTQDLGVQLGLPGSSGHPALPLGRPAIEGAAVLVMLDSDEGDTDQVLVQVDAEYGGTAKALREAIERLERLHVVLTRMEHAA